MAARLHEQKAFWIIDRIGWDESSAAAAGANCCVSAGLLAHVFLATMQPQKPLPVYVYSCKLKLN